MKKAHKKAYTIMELLAALIILGLLLLMIIPPVMDSVSKLRQRSYNQMIESVETTAQLYITNNRDKIPNINIINSNTMITLQQLVDDNMIEAPIIDPITDKEVPLSTEIFVHVLDKNKYYIYFEYRGGEKKIDFVPPVITLLGNNPINAQAKKPYIDPGANAQDDKDGNISDHINILSNVNTDVIGTYRIIYNVSDSAGNQAVQITRIVNVANFDFTGPVITFETNGNPLYAKTANTIINVVDDSDIDVLKYQWNTSTITPTEDSFNTTFTNGENIDSPVGVTGGYYLWVLAKDIFGNMTITRSEVFNLDNTGPIIASIDFNGYTPNTWTKNDINIDINATDETDIDKYQYSSDGTTWNDINSSWLINTDFNQTLTFRVVDKLGNTNDSTTYSIKRDTVKPSVPTVNLNGYISNKWTKSNVTQTFSSSDIASGIQKYQYTNNGGTTWNDISSSWLINFDVGWTLAVRAIDNAGNPSDVSSSYIVKRDTVAPAVPTVNTNGYTCNAWTMSNVTLSYSSSDSTSGFQKFQYSNNGGSTWNDIGTPWIINFDGQWTLYFRAVDNAGNTSGASSGCVVKRDATAPSVPSVNLNGYASGSWTRGNVTQSYSSSDGTSGVLKYQCSHDGSTGWYDIPNPWVISWDGQWVFYIRAVDNAGNVSGIASPYIIRRDTVAPTISMYGSNPVYMGERGTYSDAGAGASDNASGLAGGISVTSTVNPSYAGTYYVYYNISDNAGNPATQQVRTVYIQETILTKMEAVFGKGAGGCTATANFDTTIDADSSCYYHGASVSNYIYFNCDAYPTAGCQLWRIIGVKQDTAGRIGVRVLAPNGVIAAGALSFDDADNSDWDSSTIRSTLNNGAQGWLKNNIENNATYLVSMKYDKRQINQDSTWAVSSKTYSSTSNSNYVGLPSALEFAQCNNNMNNTGGTGWGDSTCWANVDSGNYWYWSVSEMYSSNYSTTKPGSYVSLNKGNCCNYRKMTNKDDTSTRPVLNLNPNLRVVGGNGTSGSPYQVAP